MSVWQDTDMRKLTEVINYRRLPYLMALSFFLSCEYGQVPFYVLILLKIIPGNHQHIPAAKIFTGPDPASG